MRAGTDERRMDGERRRRAGRRKEGRACDEEMGRWEATRQQGQQARDDELNESGRLMY